MEKSNFIWINGNLIEESKASIPVTDRGFLYGDGVFTTMKVENGIPLYFDLHLDRLHLHCKKLNISPPNLHINIIENLITANQAHEGNWRLKIIVTGGSSSTLDLKFRDPGIIMISMKPYFFPDSRPYKLTVYPRPLQRIFGDVKTLSYLDNLAVREYAFSKGCDDAIMISPEGYLLETSCANIYWIADNTLFTPSYKLPIIEGISLKNIIEKHKSLGYNVEFVKMSLKEIPKYAKMHVSNSLMRTKEVADIQT